MVDIKRSRVGEVKVGQAMAWERSGEDTEGRGKKAREEAAWMEQAIQIDIERERERERLVPGRDELRCEL